MTLTRRHTRRRTWPSAAAAVVQQSAPRRALLASCAEPSRLGRATAPRGPLAQRTLRRQTSQRAYPRGEGWGMATIAVAPHLRGTGDREPRSLLMRLSVDACCGLRECVRAWWRGALGCVFETTRGEIIRAMQKSQSSHCRRAPRLVQCSAKSGLHQAAQSAVPVGSVRAGARSSSGELRPADACPAISKTAVKWRAAADAIVVIEYYGTVWSRRARARRRRARWTEAGLTSIDRLVRVRK